MSKTVVEGRSMEGAAGTLFAQLLAAVRSSSTYQVQLPKDLIRDGNLISSPLHMISILGFT